MLIAYPIVDGPSYKVLDYFEQLVFELDEDGGDHILIYAIGDPEKSGPIFDRLACDELKKKVARDGDWYVDNVVARGRDRHHRLAEVRKLRDFYRLKTGEVPCLVFRPGDSTSLVGLLRIPRSWYQTEMGLRIFAESFRQWMQREDVKKLATAKLDEATLKGRLGPLLDVCTQETNARIKGRSEAVGRLITMGGSAEVRRQPSRPRMVPAGRESMPALDDNAWYNHVQLAEAFEVNRESLRKRLGRFRNRNQNGWKQNEDRRSREPGYLYRLAAIRPIIQDLLASAERPAK